MAIQKVDNDYDFQKITRERLLWLLKPLFTLGLVVWCLHPNTTTKDVVEQNAELGFLLGAVFGIIMHRNVFKYFLVTRRKETRHRRNRVPDEYYFGKIIKVLLAEEK